MNSIVVQLPTELNRLRESDRLLQRWVQIRADLAGSEKAAALIGWVMEVEQHESRFLVNAPQRPAR